MVGRRGCILRRIGRKRERDREKENEGMKTGRFGVKEGNMCGRRERRTNMRNKERQIQLWQTVDAGRGVGVGG